MTATLHAEIAHAGVRPRLDNGPVSPSRVEGLKFVHDTDRRLTTITLDVFPNHRIEVAGTTRVDVQRLIALLGPNREVPSLLNQFDLITKFLCQTDRENVTVTIALTAVHNVPVSEFLDASLARWKFDQWRASLGSTQETTQSVVTKNDLFDSKRVDQIVRSLGGQFVVCSLDYRGVGDGNNYGFRTSVDKFFSRVRARCNSDLAGRAILVDWGGDERVLLVRRDSAEGIFSEFLKINEDVRAETFASTEESFRKLHQALELREKFRAVSKDFSAGLDLEAQDGAAAVLELFEEFPRLKEANLDPDAAMILGLARRSAKTGNADLPIDFFLGVSCGRVDFGTGRDPVTPEAVLKAVAQGFRGQLATKIGGALPAPEPVKPELQLRDADINSLQAGADLAHTRNQLLGRGQGLQSSHVGFLVAGQIALSVNRSDSSLTRVDGAPLFILNANKSKDLSLARLDIKPPVSVVKFDMSAFRQFNNTLGYSEADARFLKFAQAIEAECAGVHLVRSGGSIFLLASGEFPGKMVDRVRTALEDSYATFVDGPDAAKVRFQFELDRTRALYDSLVRDAPQQVIDSLCTRRFGSPEVTVLAPFTGSEDTPLYDVISR